MKTGTINREAPCSEKEQNDSRKRELTVKAVMHLLGGILLMNGKSAPFGVSLCAASKPVFSAAALFGMTLRAAVGGRLIKYAPELAAGFLSLLYIFIFREKNTRRLRALSSGTLYFISSAAIAAGSGGWTVFLGTFFKGVICGAGTYSMLRSREAAEKGLKDGGSATEKLCAMAMTYMIFISALCGMSLKLITLGRIAAAFCTMAAARKFGSTGGAAAGILSAAAFLLAEPSLGRSGAITAFGGLAAGICHSRGKYAVDMTFILSVFGLTAAAGMPSGTPALICDMGLGAALYCLIPESIYLPRLSGIFSEKRPDDIRADKLHLMSRMMEEVTEDVRTSAEFFQRDRYDREEICAEVKSLVCSRFCGKRKCSAACGRMSAEASDPCFRAAQSLAEKTGRLTEKELPAGFEGCRERARLAACYNRSVGMRRLQIRKASQLRRLLENTADQLEASFGIMEDASERDMSRRDAGLSRALRNIMEEHFYSVRSAELYFDRDMSPVAEVYINADDDFNALHLNEITPRLSSLLGVRLASPNTLVIGEKKRICRIRWRKEGKYIPDSHITETAAEGVCGDSHVSFEDGLGGFYIILADGMGRGAAAASRSSLAVNLLRRMITGGMSAVNAVKMLNVIMNAVSSDEIFTTADIFRVDLTSGEAFLIKMGASPTAVMRREEGADILDIYSQSSVPLGIIGSVSITEEKFVLDENSRLLMTTDGIDITDKSIAAVLENDGLTCEQISDRINALSEDSSDDRTAAVFRLYLS